VSNLPIPAHIGDDLMSNVNKIELWADRTDSALLKAALNDLLDKVMVDQDFYGVGKNINDLLTQLKENN
jgi:hypothetical protein